MNSFQLVLKSLRKSKNLTQGDLASILGISVSAISMYENGNREPDFETLEQIADFFNVDMNYLLGKSDQTTILNNSPSEYEIKTIAAHHDGEWTAEELEEIEQFKAFVKMRRSKDK